MKHFLLICLSFLLLTSCSYFKKELVDSRITKFERFLGKEKAYALNEKVEDFENFLSINFPQLSTPDAYKKYLEIIRDNEYENIEWEIDSSKKERIISLIKSSGLDKEIWKIREYIVLSSDQQVSFDSTQGVFKNNYLISLDSSNSYKDGKANLKLFNIFGKYLQGLKLIQKSDSVLEFYVSIKEIAGHISRPLLADDLLYNKADFKDYFIKRIVVVEFYITNF